MSYEDDPITTSVTASPSEILDRSVGAVLASAAGDALGAGYEFGPPLPDDLPVEMIGGGAFSWTPGEWTDDTQMALAVLMPLADGAVDLARIEAGFRAWYDSGPADVGNQTSAILGQAGSLAEVAAAFTAARPDRASGNGSLMRTGPVALAHPVDAAAIAGLAADISSLTHPDPDCSDACILWSVAIDDAIHHAPPVRSGDTWDWASSLRQALPHLPTDGRRSRWNDLIDEAEHGHPLDFPNNGWVVHAFQAALSAICRTPVPDDRPEAHLALALSAAVRAGGDTDTVAAIAGSLLGARWGEAAVPGAWREIIHGCHIYGRPALSAADLCALAVRAVEARSTNGHVDS